MALSLRRYSSRFVPSTCGNSRANGLGVAVSNWPHGRAAAAHKSGASLPGVEQSWSAASPRSAAACSMMATAAELSAERGRREVGRGGCSYLCGLTAVEPVKNKSDTNVYENSAATCVPPSITQNSSL